jgi:outer membrane PBP1 activator LpoA protein
MKKSLTAYTYITIITSLILTGCASNRTHTPAPVITAGQTTTKPNPVIVSKSTPTISEIKPESPITNTTPEPTVMVASELSEEEKHAAVQKMKQEQTALRKVVILLPDHPSLGDVNRDIEKGIRAAHQQRPHNHNLQLLFVHDQLPADQLLNKAKSFAPDWIIGPLTKTDIQTISTQLDAKQILLNRLDNPTVALQLGLPVEDETAQLLTTINASKQPIAVIASNDAIEQRILAGLQQKANALNIPVLVIEVNKQNADISQWLDGTGGIAQSRQRIERMGKLLRTKFETTPQPRHDLQALILLGNAKQAHSFMPAVQYHQISWPILATSRLLPTRKGDKFNEPDFEGIRVLTPPYLLSETGPETPFEALGWDSYQLLANPKALNIDGMTGKLLPNENNQVLRQLTWQRIRQNQLLPLKQR